LIQIKGYRYKASVENRKGSPEQRRQPERLSDAEKQSGAIDDQCLREQKMADAPS